jgi:hypothetical protein
MGPIHNCFSHGVVGNTVCLKLLLLAGADVELRDSHGRTPLLTAITYSDFDNFAMLLGAGASLRVKDNDGMGPLEHVTFQYKGIRTGAENSDQRAELKWIRIVCRKVLELS